MRRRESNNSSQKSITISDNSLEESPTNCLKFYALKPPNDNGYIITNSKKVNEYLLLFLQDEVVLKLYSGYLISNIVFPETIEDGERYYKINLHTKTGYHQSFKLSQNKSNTWSVVNINEWNKQQIYEIWLTENGYFIRKTWGNKDLVAKFLKKMFESKEGTLYIDSSLNFEITASLILSLAMVIYCHKCFKLNKKNIQPETQNSNENFQAKHLAIMGSVDNMNDVSSLIIFDNYYDLNSMRC